MLIAGQVALTLVLLTIAGAATRAFLTAYRVPLGFDVDKVTSLNLAIAPEVVSGLDGARQQIRIDSASASLPRRAWNRRAVSTTWLPPMQGYTVKTEIEGKQELDRNPIASGADESGDVSQRSAFR